MLAAACESFDAYNFAQTAFAKWTPQTRAMKRYFRVFDTARGRIRPATAEISAVVGHAAHRNADGMSVHLTRAFERGASREQLAEGLSYVLLHRGGPTMIDAVNCWEKCASTLMIPGPY